MKGNERQAKKALSVTEMEAELRQVQEKRFKLAFKHRVAAVENPLDLRNLRRHAARLKTWLHEKKAAAPAAKEAK